MLMKYKDFKTMTANEMKNIIGGTEPIEPRVKCGTCPSSSGLGELTCYKDSLGLSCLKPSTCNNAVDCKETTV